MPRDLILTTKTLDPEINIPTVAMIGFGAIAHKHLASIFKLAPLSTVGILTSQGKEKKFESYKISYHRDIREILEMKPDFAMIATDSGRHVQHVEVLLKNGANILIEKPIAACLNDAEHIRALADRYAQKVKVAYNLRFSSGLKSLKRALDTEIIGKVLSVHVTVGQNLETWRPGRDLVTTASATRPKGGGVLRELSHEIDYLRFLFGEGMPCCAMLGKQKYTELNVEDSAMILLRYRGNGNDIMASLNLDFTRHDNLRQCHIIGDKGSLRWDALAGRVTFFSSDQEEILYENSEDLPQTNIKMWRAWLAGRTKQFARVEDGLNIIADIEKFESLAGSKYG